MTQATILVHPSSVEFVGAGLALDLSNRVGCPVRLRGDRTQYLALVLEEARNAASLSRLVEQIEGRLISDTEAALNTALAIRDEIGGRVYHRGGVRFEVRPCPVERQREACEQAMSLRQKVHDAPGVL